MGGRKETQEALASVSALHELPTRERRPVFPLENGSLTIGKDSPRQERKGHPSPDRREEDELDDEAKEPRDSTSWLERLYVDLSTPTWHHFLSRDGQAH